MALTQQQRRDIQRHCEAIGHELSDIEQTLLDAHDEQLYELFSVLKEAHQTLLDRARAASLF